MKSSLVVFLFLIICSSTIILCKLKKENKSDTAEKKAKTVSKNKKPSDVDNDSDAREGEGKISDVSDNQELVQQKDFYSFGLGSNGGHSLKNQDLYKKEFETVDNLNAVRHKLKPTEKVESYAEEKESIEEYYNGEKNLNTFRLICRGFTDSKACHKISHCGWCGSSNSCVEGTPNGPVEDCKNKATYSYDGQMWAFFKKEKKGILQELMKKKKDYPKLDKK
eukprot:CAMPEP_0170529604 /NCGR_PEP_ID=MMETSP0209-20121228/26556_1 /TAXON_ID=665100 ORGANISM="Litonotus pictus, Strain P1" /NCGR_SAMPLE_ID=MMETSP0209 /ASSEMBLY_ACC=CAM_ASM_000301 /LENGTH=221 /DNA_ID=CAMNT_0010821763 /DNA_START=1 /DNA_END=666 /DNA_ORIENTATION=+